MDYFRFNDGKKDQIHTAKCQGRENFLRNINDTVIIHSGSQIS